MTHFLQDLRFAVRQLALQPTFAAIAVVTLALGIGATTTCFSVLNAVALRPIPFADPDQLLEVHIRAPRGSGLSRLAPDRLRALQELHEVFSGAVAYAARTVTAAASGTAADRVQAAEISGDLFSLLGTPVQMGRPLVSTDAGTRVVVISHDLWVRAFGSNASAVGATLLVDGDLYTVVGIAAPRFSFPQDSRVWLPLDTTPRAGTVEVVARVRPGISTAQADAALAAASADILAGPAVEDSTGWTVVSMPLRRSMIGTKQRDMALFVLTAAGLVLLIACANLAGLLSAHLGGRKHEIAIRSAIGAGRGRLVQQLMTESGVLALAGGVLGVLLAQWGVDMFAATLGKPSGAEWIEFSVDGRVLLFALMASTATAFLFGLVPALGGSRADLRCVLQEDRTSAGLRPARRRTRAVLVAGQVALSICLVSGAAAVVTSALRFEEIDPGFNRAGLLTINVALAGRAYEHPEQRLAFVDSAIQRLRMLPGVAAVGAASHVPLVDRNVPSSGFIPEGTDPAGRPPNGSVRFVDADYLGAIGIPVHRGRAFNTSESRDLHGHVIIINDTMARRYWSDRDPIGSRLRLVGSADLEGAYEVIGVVGNVAQRNLPADPENQMYLPLASASDLTLVVRASSDPASLAGSARDAVRAVDDSVAVAAQTMTMAFRWYVMDRRMQGMVLGTIGLIAVLVAALGIYGIVSLMVTERSREFAIRRALGASSASVMRLVLGRGIGLSGAGVAAGLLLAVALTAFLSSIFQGVRAVDVWVLAGSAALLGSVTIGASWWPARRAMGLDPMAALKQ